MAATAIANAQPDWVLGLGTTQAANQWSMQLTITAQMELVPVFVTKYQKRVVPSTRLVRLVFSELKTQGL